MSTLNRFTPLSTSTKVKTIIELLSQEKIHQADHIYCQGKADKLHFYLDVILCHKDVLKNNPLLLPSETLLVKDLKETAFSPGKRVKCLLAFVSCPLSTPSMMWWCDKFQALSTLEQETLAKDLINQGLLRECCQHPSIKEHSNILVGSLPLFFWEKSFHCHPSTFHLWLQQQDEETIGFLVKKLQQQGVLQDHAMFQGPVLQRYILKQEINEGSPLPNPSHATRKM